jgi:predicted dehydrogenase
VRLGFVGLGWATQSFHIPAAKRVPDAEPIGGCDPAPERRTAFERQSSLPSYATLDELVERGRPEAVVVATPPDSHTELCLQALAAGLHVICEKPFAATVDDADQILAAADAAGKGVAVNHEFREKPIFKAVKERVGSAEAGRLVFTQIWQLMNLAPWDEPVAWRAAMPNRTLFEGGVHLVDLLLYLYDELPEAVFARHSSGLDPGRDADAIHLVTLEYPGGRLAQITIDRLCPAGTRYVELRADCERESVRASLGGRALVRLGAKRAQGTGVRLEYAPGGLAWTEQGLKSRRLARNPRDAGVLGTARLLDGIIRAFHDDREPPSSGQEARDGLRVIEAAYRSASTGERVALGRP